MVKSRARYVDGSVVSATKGRAVEPCRGADAGGHRVDEHHDRDWRVLPHAAAHQQDEGAVCHEEAEVSAVQGVEEGRRRTLSTSGRRALTGREVVRVEGDDLRADVAVVRGCDKVLDWVRDGQGCVLRCKEGAERGRACGQGVSVKAYMTGVGHRFYFVSKTNVNQE